MPYTQRDASYWVPMLSHDWCTISHVLRAHFASIHHKINGYILNSTGNQHLILHSISQLECKSIYKKKLDKTYIYLYIKCVKFMQARV